VVAAESASVDVTVAYYYYKRSVTLFE